MEVVDDVYVFAFDTEYFGNDRTWHPVGVETETGLVLIDAGGPDDEDKLEAAMAEHGFDYGDVETILLTHQDYDHLGCLAPVAERTDAPVVAHRKAAPYVRGDVKMIKRPEEPYPGVPVALELTGGERFQTNAGPVEAIFTPGHAPGHLVFYLPEPDLLVAGDLLRGDGEYGLGGPKRSVTPDLAESRRSIGELTNLDLEQVLCFHGGPVEATGADVQRVYDDLLGEVASGVDM